VLLSNGDILDASFVSKEAVSGPRLELIFEAGGGVAGPPEPARPPVFDGAHVWVVNFQAATVAKIRASDNALVSTTPISGGPLDAVYDGAHLWVTHLGGAVGLTKIRASDGAVTATYAVSEGGAVSGLTYDGEHLWLGAFAGTTLPRLHSAIGAVTAIYTAPQNIGPVVFDGTHVGTGHASTGAVSKFRASDGTLIGTYPSGLPNLTAMVFDGEALWIARSAVVKMDPATGAGPALPSASAPMGARRGCPTTALRQSCSASTPRMARLRVSSSLPPRGRSRWGAPRTASTSGSRCEDRTNSSSLELPFQMYSRHDGSCGARCVFSASNRLPGYHKSYGVLISPNCSTSVSAWRVSKVFETHRFAARRS
jgi:hypothetical protein